MAVQWVIQVGSMTEILTLSGNRRRKVYFYFWNIYTTYRFCFHPVL